MCCLMKKIFFSLVIIDVYFQCTDAVQYRLIRGKSPEVAKQQCEDQNGNLTIFKDLSSLDLSRFRDMHDNMSIWNGYQAISPWLENTGCFENMKTFDAETDLQEGMSVVGCQRFCMALSHSYRYAIKAKECRCILETDVKENFCLVDSTYCNSTCNNRAGEFCGSQTDTGYYNIYKEASSICDVPGSGYCLRYDWKPNGRDIHSISCDSDSLLDMIACRNITGQVEWIHTYSWGTWESSQQHCSKIVDQSNYIVSFDDLQYLPPIKLYTFVLNERKYESQFKEKVDGDRSKCQVLVRDSEAKVFQTTRNCSNLDDVAFVCKLDYINAEYTENSRENMSTLTGNHVSDMTNRTDKHLNITVTTEHIVNMNVTTKQATRGTENNVRRPLTTTAVVMILFLAVGIVTLTLIIRRQKRKCNHAFLAFDNINAVSNITYSYNTNPDSNRSSTFNFREHYTTINEAELLGVLQIPDQRCETSRQDAACNESPFYYILEETPLSLSTTRFQGVDTNTTSINDSEQDDEYNHLTHERCNDYNANEMYAHAYTDRKLNSTHSSETVNTNSDFSDVQSVVHKYFDNKEFYEKDDNEVKF